MDIADPAGRRMPVARAPPAAIRQQRRRPHIYPRSGQGIIAGRLARWKGPAVSAGAGPLCSPVSPSGPVIFDVCDGRQAFPVFPNNRTSRALSITSQLCHFGLRERDDADRTILSPNRCAGPTPHICPTRWKGRRRVQKAPQRATAGVECLRGGQRHGHPWARPRRA